MGGGRTADIIDEYRHPRDIADRFADIFKKCLPTEFKCKARRIEE